mgnify:CR=1 FL=1
MKCIVSIMSYLLKLYLSIMVTKVTIFQWVIYLYVCFMLLLQCCLTAVHLQVNYNRYDNLIVSGEVWIKPSLISAYLKCHTIRLYFLLSNLIFVEPRYTCDNRFKTVKVFFDPCFIPCKGKYIKLQPRTC